MLDWPLEYKKGEMQTNVEITNEEDWNTILGMGEEYRQQLGAELSSTSNFILRLDSLLLYIIL